MGNRTSEGDQLGSAAANNTDDWNSSREDAGALSSLSDILTTGLKNLETGRRWLSVGSGSEPPDRLSNPRASRGWFTRSEKGFEDRNYLEWRG